MNHRQWRMFPRIPGFVPGDYFQEKMKMLGVILDPQLTWGPHMAHVSFLAFLLDPAIKLQQIQVTKVAPLRRAFQRILGSNHGPPLERAVQLYRTTVFTTISYASAVWFDPLLFRKDHLAYLHTTQNMFLRIIAQAYPKASIPPLEKELRVRSVAVELKRLRNVALAKLSQTAVWSSIRSAHQQV